MFTTPILAVTLFVATLYCNAQTQQSQKDPLQPLLVLVGSWHGEGSGPYGPYEYENVIERRGRWIVLRSTIFKPRSDTVFYYSTQVYGYSDKGLTLHLYDTYGVFEFVGDTSNSGVKFQWRGGESWKRTEMRPTADGRIHARYDAYEPSMFKEPVGFEGFWLPGKRIVPTGKSK